MTAQQIVDLLNEAARLDPRAMQTLLGLRVPCAEEFEEHPSIQIGQALEGYLSLGLLGILNGIAALDGELIESRFNFDGPGMRPGEFLGFRLCPRDVAVTDTPATDGDDAPR
jgi:hypothetical protein